MCANPEKNLKRKKIVGSFLNSLCLIPAFQYLEDVLSFTGFVFFFFFTFQIAVVVLAFAFFFCLSPDVHAYFLRNLFPKCLND